MIKRFANRRIIKNDSPIYKNYLDERGRKFIEHYETIKMDYPTNQQLKSIIYLEHVWSAGDRLYKLSNRYYGNTKDWWIILKFNKIGSEFEIQNGDTIKIPLRLEEVIGII
jgi:hypothetical protein